MGLASAILAILLVVTGLELRREFASAGALRAAVERSYDTRLQVQSVFSLLQDAETGQRGYIITGDERFLEPYDEALTQLDAQMAALGVLFGRDDVQAADHLRLSERITRKRMIMEQTINLREAGDVSGATAAVSSGRGKAVMDDIRRVVDRMTQREAENLATSAAGAQTRTLRTEIMVVLLFAALVGIAGEQPSHPEAATEVVPADPAPVHRAASGGAASRAGAVVIGGLAGLAAGVLAARRRPGR